VAQVDAGIPEISGWLWSIATGVAGWDSHPTTMALLTLRWIGLASFAPGVGSATVGFNFRITIAILLSGIMAVGEPPVLALTKASWAALGLVMVSEFVIGVGLGLSISLWIAAARAAGEWVALLSGLNIQTTYQPDWDGDSGDLPSTIGRLFSLVGLVVFFVSRGPLRLLDLVSESITACPLGQGLNMIGQAQAETVFRLVGEALALSILASWPILLALTTAQMSVALASRSQSVALSWSLLAPTRLAIGLVILAAGLAGVSAGLSRTLDPWLLRSAEAMHGLSHPDVGPPRPLEHVAP
jgi:flagellar biosynthesis protein FliR